MGGQWKVLKKKVGQIWPNRILGGINLYYLEPGRQLRRRLMGF